jgi:hypothetical protein
LKCIKIIFLSFENLEIEWSSLETGFDELEKEIETHHLQNRATFEEYDEFMRLASDFHESRSDEVLELKRNFNEMKKEVFYYI